MIIVVYIKKLILFYVLSILCIMLQSQLIFDIIKGYIPSITTQIKCHEHLLEYTNNVSCYNLRELDSVVDCHKQITLRFDCNFNESCSDINVFNLIDSCLILPMDLSKIVYSYVSSFVTINIHWYDEYILRLYFNVNNVVYKFSLRYDKYVQVYSEWNYSYDFIKHNVTFDYYTAFFNVTKMIKYTTDYNRLLINFNSHLTEIRIINMTTFLKIMCCTCVIVDYIQTCITFQKTNSYCSIS